MRRRNLLLVPAMALLALTQPAAAVPTGPVLHEQIPPDPREDLAFSASLDGDIPIAIDTNSGPVSAPDPRRPVPPTDPSQTPKPPEDENTTFKPDRNTKRPDVQGYDEPFTPSTAPFKRLEAYDTVNEAYELSVADKRFQTLTPGAQPAADGSEEQFFADLVVEVAANRKTRIPSVGPGARIVRAHLGVGPQTLHFNVMKDGAENWFVEGFGASTRARLVMELTIPRAAFGGDYSDAGWNELPKLKPLPAKVMDSAKEVQAALGVSAAMRPREIVNKLVTYFRGFADSDDPPRGRRDIYQDLALSRKGVCRHRAFAFMITAQSLGIPARLVLNEAHAWVEAHDGVFWRRLDLGGAGRMVNPASNAMPERQVHKPPPDAFQWPQGSERGEDMVDQARERARQQLQQQNATGPDANGRDGGASPSSSGGFSLGDGGPLAAGASSSGPVPPASPTGSGPSSASAPGSDKPDDRSPSIVTLTISDANAHRGMPLNVRGDVKADGDPCANVMVKLYLRHAKDAQRAQLLDLGVVATNEKGTFTGSIVVPSYIPLGDYDVVAQTPGDNTRCGRGGSL